MSAEPPRRSSRQTPGSHVAEAGPYLVIGIQMAGGMTMFIFAGYFADRWLGTTPWLLLVGAVLGVTASLFTVIRMANELGARDHTRRAKSTGHQAAAAQPKEKPKRP